jgi:rhodanese-related sulfurtransferase
MQTLFVFYLKPIPVSFIRFPNENKINNQTKMKLVENLDANTFEKKLAEDKNAVLLDVRTPMEHQMVRIPNSILIDINNPMFMEEIGKLDKNKSYYVYCRSGSRSLHAGNYMLKAGFEKVYNLQTGIIGWKGKKEFSI